MSFAELKNKTKEFFAKIGKRNMIIIGAVLLIGVAVLVNWMLFKDAGKKDDGYTYSGGSGMVGELENSKSPTTGNEDSNTNAQESSDSYFSSVQVSRQRARDEALEVLNSVIENKNASEQVKSEAAAEIKQLSLEMTQEADIESLITSKGFEKCVAVVNGNSASIIVSCEGNLTPAQLAQINAAVYQLTKIEPSNITVVAKSK